MLYILSLQCSIRNKVEVLKWINCREIGHLAAWRGCKVLPTVPEQPPDNQEKHIPVQDSRNQRREEKDSTARGKHHRSTIRPDRLKGLLRGPARC
ncbi:hypothetical protein AVEN_207805-1 [Araneus ventricosus]|uniref:Uncharacterized protein n=1 Tax=Araneus ventricosus TaxID=182803 RepID=A0A4Y2BWT6_ARAVE|nr:hypothetical protein AVEN_207805-1 [Araneus ventricosus]